MKKTFKFLIVMLLGTYSFGQTLDVSPSSDIKMVLIPEGVFEHNSLEIGVNGFWMSEEITNKQFREFIDDLKANPNDSLGLINLNKVMKGQDLKNVITFYSYKDVLDNITYSKGWNGEHSFENYFYSEKYNDYPVVGISFESSRLFCIWKTRQLNNHREKNGLPYIADFRLPTEIEWLYAAQGTEEGNVQTAFSELRPSKSGDSNIYGLHNMNSNVSEWTINKSEEGEGIIKGSSWKKTININERIIKPVDYKSNSVGFRIIMSDLRE